MLFSTSLKFFGVAFLLPVVLATPLPADVESHGSTRKTRRITLVGKLGGQGKANAIGDSDDDDIKFPTFSGRQTSPDSDEYAVYNWKMTVGDVGRRATAMLYTLEDSYNAVLEQTSVNLLAYGQDVADRSWWLIYPVSS